MSITKGLILDAILGENTPRPLTYKGKEFLLPGGLPGDTLLPLLDPQLGLMDLIVTVFDDADDESEWFELLLDALRKRNTLPMDLLAAGQSALQALFDDEVDGQYEKFVATKPSVKAWWTLVSNLGDMYGVGLGDFFGSGDSSPNGGTSSSPTSGPSTESTSEPSSPSTDDPQPVTAPKVVDPTVSVVVTPPAAPKPDTPEQVYSD